MKDLCSSQARLIVNFCFADDEEKRQIAEALTAFEEIKPIFFDTFRPQPLYDAYLLPSRSLLEIPQKRLIEHTYPIMAFGPVEHIRASLAYGVKDFIIYPFAGEELACRIIRQTLQRFTYTEDRSFRFSEDRVITDENSVSITYTEYLILKYLVGASPFPIERDLLLECLPNLNDAGSRSLDMSISKLRKKLRYVLSFDEELVIAERGYGYRIIKR